MWEEADEFEKEFIAYEEWMAAETQRELEEEFREEYGAPYDYNEI